VPLPADSVRGALATIDPLDLTLVPDDGRLASRIARSIGLPDEMVLVGPGADACLAWLVAAFVRDGDEVVHPEPTYHRYSEMFELAGAVCRPVRESVTSDRDLLDSLASIGDDTALVVVVNPDSPSGSAAGCDAIESLVVAAAAVDALVVVDEVYFGFGAETALPLVTRHPNVAVVRSFSKAWGLAGLRVGFLAASADVVRAAAARASRYPVSALSERVVDYFLDHPEITSDYAQEVCRSRELVVEGAAALGLSAVVGLGSWALVELPAHVDRSLVAALLLDRGIEVNAGLGSPWSHAVRITLGPWAQVSQALEQVAAAIDELGTR